VNPIVDWDSRRFQLADRGCNPAISQVVTRVVVKPDDQNSGVMARGSDDQVMEVFGVFGILSQDWESLGNRVDKHPRIRN
jgi:hypothetical protein